jgi:hypothetical protein
MAWPLRHHAATREDTRRCRGHDYDLDMPDPQPTPQEKSLKRVLTISRLNGWSVAVVAALGTLVTLLLGDLTGTLVGLVAVASGWMEIRGNGKLQRKDASGMTLLVRSQLLLLGVLLAYCVIRLGSFDAETAMANLTPDMEAILKEAGLERGDILPMVSMTYYATYSAVAATCLIYQGGMALYYRSRTNTIITALSLPPNTTGP